MKGAYGPAAETIDLSRGLELVADALNGDDLGRAMVAALRLRLPGLSWDSAARIASIDESLAKYNFNPDEPRDWRGRWTSSDNLAPPTAARSKEVQSKEPNAPKDHDQESVSPRGANVSIADLDFSGEGVPFSDASEIGPNQDDHAELIPAGYNGVFHDQVVRDVAAYLESRGQIVATEVSLQMADGSAKARLDILAYDPTIPILYAVEVKTGDRPEYTEGQLVVYPHLMMGESVVSLTGRTISFGILPNELLPPMPLFKFYQKDKGSPIKIKREFPESMKRYHKNKSLLSPCLGYLGDQ